MVSFCHFWTLPKIAQFYPLFYRQPFAPKLSTMTRKRKYFAFASTVAESGFWAFSDTEKPQGMGYLYIYKSSFFCVGLVMCSPSIPSSATQPHKIFPLIFHHTHFVPTSGPKRLRTNFFVNPH